MFIRFQRDLAANNMLLYEIVWQKYRPPLNKINGKLEKKKQNVRNFKPTDSSYRTNVVVSGVEEEKIFSHYAI